MTGLNLEALASYLSHALGGAVEIRAAEPLYGGAIQQNMRLRIEVADGANKGDFDWVLRRDAPAVIASSRSRVEEYRLLQAAWAAGVAVPTPRLLCEDPSMLEAPCFLMDYVAGEASPTKLTKAADNKGLVRDLGRNLARIHSIGPGRDGEGSDLGFLGQPPENAALAVVERCRCGFDALPARPVFEWGLEWLERNAPGPGQVSLCHRDFRTGNYLVAEGRLAAVLDWEFAAWSDPHEDLGWICARCWRFGADEREVGGVGARDDFYRAYSDGGGVAVDPERVAYWELMAHVRWGLIALEQAERHVSGRESSLELALTAHLVPALELEVLRLCGMPL